MRHSRRCARPGRSSSYGPDAFAGMRKAGQLVAECLDRPCRRGEARRADRAHRQVRVRLRDGPRRAPRDADVSRLQQVDLHVDQPRRLPRHPEREAAAGRRHRQHRRDADPRRLARRFEPHVPGRRNSAQGRAADRGDLRGDDARHRGGEARPHHRRHRPRDPDLRRAAAHERGARFLRPRPRPPVPRRAEHRAYRPRRRRHRAQARHAVHHRADDQSRPPACEGPVRRLDRGHARPLALGAVRAHGRRDRDRRRDLHPLAQGADKPPYLALLYLPLAAAGNSGIAT